MKVRGVAAAMGDAEIVDSGLTEPVKSWLAGTNILGWAHGQTNCALRRERDAAAGEKLLMRGNLPLHPDPPKNWDSCLALVHAVTSTDPATPVLDAGAERYSPFLPGLARLGFRDLTGINLTFGAPEIVDGAALCHGDITRTAFSKGHFGFIASLSVIEHGVDVAAFLAEGARLLRPGGALFLSFDYWQEPIDTRGQSAYGVPIRVFSPDDVEAMIDAARAVGLEPDGPCNFACENRVVHWRRFDLRYTFANLLLRKVGP